MHTEAVCFDDDVEMKYLCPYGIIEEIVDIMHIRLSISMDLRVSNYGIILLIRYVYINPIFFAVIVKNVNG